MSFLDPFNMIGKAKDTLFPDASKSAGKYLNQIPGTIKPYYEPYINAGNQATSTLQEQFAKLLQNPGEFMKVIGGGFQQAPGYQFALNQGLGAAENAAAAGGMTGSPQHQQQAAQMATGLANQDYYNYLDRTLGAYNQGLQGTQNMFNTGYNASSNLASDLASSLMSQANLKYAGKNNQNQAFGGALGSLASMFMGGM